MQLSIHLTGDEKVKAILGDSGKQALFAASVALNNVAKDVRRAVPSGLQKSLDRPSPFTASESALRIDPAKKDKLSVGVLFKDRQASYMRFQTDGGVRAPSRKALRLPSAIQLNEYGNLPKGIISQLIAVARKETKLGKRKARRIRVSNKVALFYGQPSANGRGKQRPAGIYKEVDLGGGRAQLVPLIVFPRISATYQKRVDLMVIARPIVVDNFARHFDQALQSALASAR